MKILFIDDDKWTLDLINILFEEDEGIEIKTALTAADGLMLLLDGSFDYAFIDFKLDGSFTASTIVYSLREKKIKTKIYILSGYEEVDIITKINPVKDLIAGILKKESFRLEVLNTIGYKEGSKE